MSLRVLVTGASGFVGQEACTQAVRQGFVVRAALRKYRELPGSAEPVIVGEMTGATDWAEALREMDVVIHLAARAHVMRDQAADPLAEFRRTNLDGTLSLARQAVVAGVRRFVVMSSIGVKGAETDLAPVSADDAAAPP
jgi:nucleoside-diphosphate-sugar epimerase